MSKNSVHQSHKSWWAVAKSERNYFVLVKLIVSSECGFWSIFYGNRKFPIPIVEFKFANKIALSLRLRSFRLFVAKENYLWRYFGLRLGNQSVLWLVWFRWLLYHYYSWVTPWNLRLFDQTICLHIRFLLSYLCTSKWGKEALSLTYRFRISGIYFVFYGIDAAMASIIPLVFLFCSFFSVFSLTYVM